MPDEFAVIITTGRPGPWGNPVVRGRDCPECSNVHWSAGDTLPCYRKYLTRRLEADANFRAAAEQLHLAIVQGAVLNCKGCGIGGQTCHTRVLEEELHRRFGGE